MTERLSRARLVIVLATTAILAMAVYLMSPAAVAQGDEMYALLMSADGSPVGTSSFTQRGNKVLLQAEVRNLSPGFHGFHVHAVGNCDAATAFTSAGGHLNPAGSTHGDHAGDLPSMYVNQDGTGSISVWVDRFTLASLADADGSALVVHAEPDNFAHIPDRYGLTLDETTLNTGDAGARIACGLVQRGKLG